MLWDIYCALTGYLLCTEAHVWRGGGTKIEWSNLLIWSHDWRGTCSIYTHLKSHIAHKNRMVKLIDGSHDPRGTSCGPFSIIIALPTGLREYVFDFPVLFVRIQTNPPICQFYWNACEPPKSERNIRDACELLKSEKFVRKQQHKQNRAIYAWKCLFS